MTIEEMRLAITLWSKEYQLTSCYGAEAARNTNNQQHQIAQALQIAELLYQACAYDNMDEISTERMNHAMKLWENLVKQKTTQES
jgi:hypothetical protein